MRAGSSGGSGKITSKTRNMMNLLYSMPPGTNLKPYLKDTAADISSLNAAKLKPRTGGTPFDPNGRIRIYGSIDILENSN